MRRDKASQNLTYLILAARRLKALQCWPTEEGKGVPLAMIGDWDCWQLRRLTDAKHNPSPSAAFDLIRQSPVIGTSFSLCWPVFTSTAPVAAASLGNGTRTCYVSCWPTSRRSNRSTRTRKRTSSAGKLKQDAPFKRRYRRYSAETIRRKLQDSRNPTHNDALDYLLDAHKPDSPIRTGVGTRTENHRESLAQPTALN